MRRIILGSLLFIGAITLAAGLLDPLKSNAPFLWTVFFVGLAVAVGSVTRDRPRYQVDESDTFWGM